MNNRTGVNIIISLFVHNLLVMNVQVPFHQTYLTVNKQQFPEQVSKFVNKEMEIF